MKERPILMSAPMVRAILEGRKSQTRRVSGLDVINAYPDRYEFIGTTSGPGSPHYAFRDKISGAQTLVKCGKGQPGDRLWVRETFQDARRAAAGRVLYRASGDISCGWKPSIFMPRDASRITLEITGVRVERLHGITVSDAIAEGYDGSVNDPVDPAITWYTGLWDSINGAGAWDKNPWVWVVEFKVVKP